MKVDNFSTCVTKRTSVAYGGKKNLVFIFRVERIVKDCLLRRREIRIC